MHGNWTKKVSLIRSNIPNQESYREYIKLYPGKKKQRDALINRLEEIAKEKFQTSKRFDMNAFYCLHLIRKFKEADTLNEELEKKLIETSYGSNSQSFDEAFKLQIPTTLEELKRKYKQISDDLVRLETNIKISHSAIETSRKKIENARKRFTKSENLIPDDYRSITQQLDQVQQDYDNHLQAYNRELQRVKDRQTKFENRTKLISELISKLNPDSVHLPENTMAMKQLDKIRLILANINGNSPDDKYVMRKLKSFLLISSNGRQINTQEYNIPKTPEPKRSPILQLSPKPSFDEIQHEFNKVKTMLQQKKSVVTPPSKYKTIDDLKKQFESLQKTQRKEPEIRTPPLKSSR
ncbi:hypothetical protein GPJ56_002530 [Histomonas meleagridis]|uniref:uncharacterized protein n=1 Tax=Histomonas meleagridis TaxID=135588 RepID=UPI003559F703|nr:hypothetical protein GPJ56_002530 [Histomonas meleagridis]KAH0806007.1 hypothetical protein GO595_001168 [Histomonas meleagridis]